MKKRCTGKCGRLLEANTDNFYEKKPGILRSDCKECHKAVMRPRSKQHYENNKAYYLKRNSKRRGMLRDMIREAKSVPCTDCGKPYPYYVMDLDHVRGKKLHDLSRMSSEKQSIAAIKKELKKCDPVCANCHRIRTFKRAA